MNVRPARRRLRFWLVATLAALLGAALLGVAPTAAAGVSRSYTGHRPVIALTIDDCFSGQAVLDDLAILRQLHVNATWFPVGRAMAANAVAWRRVAAAGYPIGNHTWSHSNLTRHTAAWVIDDIRRASWIIQAVTGRPAMPLLRPPGGASNAAVVRAAGAAGIRAVVMWDLSVGDTSPMPRRANVDYLVQNGLKGKDGDIVLMHANLPYTTEALPRIIAGYRARGFDFVTVGQLYGVRGPVPFAPGSLPAKLLQPPAVIIGPPSAPRGYGIPRERVLI